MDYIVALLFAAHCLQPAVEMLGKSLIAAMWAKAGSAGLLANRRFKTEKFEFNCACNWMVRNSIFQCDVYCSRK